MDNFRRTDLAMEKRESRDGEFKVKGCREKSIGEIQVKEITFEDSEKNETRYVTFLRDKLWLISSEEADLLTDIIASELKRLVYFATGKDVGRELAVLVAGLGNSEITADAIGPQTVKKLTVTRHLRSIEPDIYKGLGSCELSAIAPGVLGQTGIETIEIIKGAVRNSEPDILIAVDALAALSIERLGSVIQLSDCGISPGSGVGNRRKAIVHKTIGVPVITVGVPTVVESSTLVFDVLEGLGIESFGSDLKKLLKSGKSFFVTPGESDAITRKLSDIISQSIMKAFVGMNI